MRESSSDDLLKGKGHLDLPDHRWIGALRLREERRRQEACCCAGGPKGAREGVGRCGV